MQVRYQVMWDNRPSGWANPPRSKAQSTAASKGIPQVVGEVHYSDNGMYGSVNFGPGERRTATAVARELRKQGYLGVTIWDTQNNPLSNMFRL